MHSLLYVSAGSSRLMEFKGIISAYNVVSIKCHNAVLNLNSKMDTSLRLVHIAMLELNNGTAASVCLVVSVASILCICGKPLVIYNLLIPCVL